MATIKFQISKIQGDPNNPGTVPQPAANHIYYAVQNAATDTNGGVNWNAGMFVTYVSVNGASSLKSQGIISKRAHTFGGIYYEDVSGVWPPTNNSNAIGMFTGIVGEDGDDAPGSYTGADGFGRALVLGDSFTKTWDAALGTFVINTNVGTPGLTQFVMQLTDFAGTVATTDSGAGMFDISSTGAGSFGNSATIDVNNPTLKFRFNNQTDKNAVLAPAAGTSGQPAFRKILGGTALAAATTATKGDVWAEAVAGDVGTSAFTILAKVGISNSADWMKQAYGEATHFTVDTANLNHRFRLADLAGFHTFLPARGTANNVGSIPVSRFIEVGSALTAAGVPPLIEQGDLKFEATAATAPQSIGRIPVAWGITDSMSKQTHLDPAYFVKSSIGAEDRLSLNPAALGTPYAANIGLNLDSVTTPALPTFGFRVAAGPGANDVIVAGTKIDGIQYNARHLTVAYNATQFFINANEELEIQPGVLGGSDWKESVKITTVASVGGTYTEDLGVTNGKFTNVNLTSGAIFDGLITQPSGTAIVLTVGSRILVRNQAILSQNGIYVVTVAGAVGTIERAPDSDSNAEVSSGNTVTVENGNTQNDSIMRLVTPDPIIVETSPQTAQQWERIAVFAITTGAGISVAIADPTKVIFSNPTTPANEALAGQTFKGIKYTTKAIEIDADVNFFKFNDVTASSTNQYLQLADLGPKTIIVGNAAAQASLLTSKKLTSSTANFVLKTNATNLDLEWGLLGNLNIAAGAGIAMSKTETIAAYSHWANNSNAVAAADDVLTYSPQSVMIRGNTSGGILNLAIGGGAIAEQGGFMARARSGATTSAGTPADLAACVFDTDNFGWNGNKLYVGWANVGW